MRIDKYLWCVRYYKTRNMVTEACKKNHITVNGIVVKPSKEVFPTDKITFRKNETPAEAYAHLELLKLSKEHYRKTGTGRPTKKDRRDIDEFGNDISDED